MSLVKGNADAETICLRNTPVEPPPVKTHQAVTVLMDKRLQKRLDSTCWKINLFRHRPCGRPTERSYRSTHVMIIEGRVTGIQRIALWMEEPC